MNTQTIFHDKLVSFDEDSSGLFAKHEQYLPDDYLSRLRAEKLDPDHQRMGEFYKVAEVPVALVEELKRRYNFDVMREPVRETMKMLRKLQFDLFITTSKRI